MPSLRQSILPICCLLALLAHSAPAEPHEEVDSIEDAFSLREVVVTGTRSPKLLKDTPIQTRLISMADMRQADATNLQDLLQAEIPGVEFSYAMNQQVNMNFAGFAGQNVLILIDGERLAGETMENVDFARLPISSIERIEIVKGALSALYGSNAAGGVVNIITRRADKDWRANVNARAADHGEWRAGAEVATRSGIVDNVLGVNFSTIDSYNVCLDTSDECDFRTVHGCKVWNFQDRLSVRAAPGLTLTARAGYFFRERYYNPDTPDRYRDFTGGLRGEWDMGHGSKLELSYAFDQYDKSDYIKHMGLDVRDYRNVQHSLRAIFNHAFSKAFMLTAGADMMHDYLDTYQFAPGEYKEQTTAALFAQGDWTLSKHWELIGAARYDYLSDSRSSHATAKLGARYKLGALAVRGGYAGGFRAPTLKERYMMYDMAGIFEIHGNPDLKQEKSQNLNLSAEYTYKNYNFTLGGNYTFVDNKITTSGMVYAPGNMPYINYINVRSMRVAGIDASVQARWANGLGARLSYAYVHEKAQGASLTPYCPARPHSLNVRAWWQHRWHKNYATEVSVSGRLLSKVSYESMYMYEPFDTKLITNPTYTLWKVQLTQEVLKGINVNIAVDNIFNYAPAVYSYNAPVTLGANLMVGLSVDIDKIVGL